MTVPPEHAHYDPLTHVAQPDHPDREAEARAALGRAIRDIGHSVSGHHVPVELLDEAAATLQTLIARLDAGTPRNRAELAQQHGRQTALGVLIDLKLSQRDLGGYVGLSRENTSRQLKDLREAGLVLVEDSVSVIPNLEALRDRADASED